MSYLCSLVAKKGTKQPPPNLPQLIFHPCTKLWTPVFLRALLRSIDD
jgi:hypothetical protein